MSNTRPVSWDEVKPPEPTAIEIALFEAAVKIYASGITPKESVSIAFDILGRVSDRLDSIKRAAIETESKRRKGY